MFSLKSELKQIVEKIKKEYPELKKQEIQDLIYWALESELEKNG